MAFVNTACQVCASDSASANNAIVFCDGAGCNLAVHQACYGIVEIPAGNWYCEKCIIIAQEARILCELCPNKFGAFKPTDNKKMAHVLCALYIPEALFGDVNSMTPVVLNHIPRSFYHKRCYICARNGRSEFESVYGVSIKCNVPECTQYFHATCGQTMGLLCERPLMKGKVAYCGFCHSHSSQIRENFKFFPAFSPLENSTLTVTAKVKQTSRKSGGRRSRKCSHIQIPGEEEIMNLSMPYDPFEINDLLKEGRKPRGRPRKQSNQSSVLGENETSSHTTLNSANERLLSPIPEIIISASPEQPDVSDCVMGIESLDISVEDNRIGNIRSEEEARSRSKRRSRSLTSNPIRLRSSSEASTQSDGRSNSRALSGQRTSRQLLDTSDTSKFVPSLSSSNKEGKKQSAVNKKVLEKKPRGRPRKQPIQSSVLGESESFVSYNNNNSTNEEACNPIPEITSVCSERPHSSDCVMEVECLEAVNVEETSTEDVNITGTDSQQSLTVANENEISSNAEEERMEDVITEVDPYLQTNSSEENDDSNDINNDTDIELREGSDSESWSNQSRSVTSNENDSSNETSNDSVSTQNILHSERIRSIFDISSEEEDNAMEFKENIKPGTVQSEIKFSATSQPTADEPSIKTGEQTVEIEERLTSDTATDAEQYSNLAKSSTDSTTSANGEVPDSNMADFIPENTKSDENYSKEDRERNESAIMDSGWQEVVPPSNGTAFSSNDKKDVIVTPVTVSTASPEDSIRKISLFEEDDRSVERMELNPVNEAGENLRDEEFMNVEPIVVTVPPDDTIISVDNKFVIPNTAKNIENADKCINAISTPAELQALVMKAKTSGELNSEVEGSNLQESEPRTCRDLRKLMNELSISPNKHLVSDSMDSFPLVHNTVEAMLPFAGFGCQTQYIGNNLNNRGSNQLPPQRSIKSNDWTHLKLHPIPKNIPKCDKLLLPKCGEFINVPSQLFYLQKLRTENGDLEKRVQMLEQKKADLLQSIPIEKEMTCAFPSPPTSERNASVGVMENEPPKQASNFWEQSEEVMEENNLLSQEQDTEPNDLVYSLFYDFNKSPSPEPIPSCIRQEFDEFLQLQNMEYHETNTSSTYSNKKKKRNCKKTSKKRRLK